MHAEEPAEDGRRRAAARYWRGTAYTKKGDREAALKDLATVAGSDNDLRASAAVDMSMIYFGRSANRGALDDCTQSLKYGSIPDAYSKQLRLMTMLGSNWRNRRAGMRDRDADGPGRP